MTKKSRNMITDTITESSYRPFDFYIPVTLDHQISVITNTTLMSENKHYNQKFPDGGFGWVIVFASFLASVIGDGVAYAFGIFIPELIKEFNITRSIAGLMAAILMSTVLLSGPVASVLCSKIGYNKTGVIGGVLAGVSFGCPYFYLKLWFIILSTCFVSGFGFGLVYLPSILIINVWFKKKLGLAMGIAVCGSGMGAFIFSPVIEALIYYTDWKTALLITGGILFTTVPCCLTYVYPSEREKSTCCTKKKKDGKKLPSHVGENTLSYTMSNEKEVYTFYSVLYKPLFIILTTSQFFICTSYGTPFMFAKDRGNVDNVPSYISSYFISAIGIGNCCGRLGLGYLSTFNGVNRFKLYSYSICLSGVLLIVTWFIKWWWLMIIDYVLYGFFTGAHIAIWPILLVDIFGFVNVNTVFGAINLFQGIGMLIGPPFFGMIYDVTKSYNVTYAISGIVMIGSGMINFIAYIDLAFRRINFNSNCLIRCR